MVRRNRIILIYLILTLNNLVSCQVKNENHSKDTNINNSKEMNILKKYGFKIPSEELFRDRIKDVFDININEYKELNQNFNGRILEHNDSEYKILIPKYGFIDESTWQPEAYLQEKYIIWNDEEADELSFFNLNNYLFYKDKTSFEALKTKRLYLFELVSDFGYIKDSDLVKYVLSLVGSKIEDINMETAYSVFIGSNGLYGKKQLRKELIQEYLVQYPDTELMFFSLAESIVNENSENYIKIYDGNRYNDAGYFLEIELKRFNNSDPTILNNGGVNAIYDKNAKFLRWSKEQKEYISLHNYVNTIYLPCTERETGNGYECENITYTIYDPDGFTNLRKEKNSSSEILQKIKTGSEIEVLDNSSDWWLIQTKEGKEGYVHKSRIKSN